MKFKIGDTLLDNNVFLAPMAGVTDLPFRLLCREQGAGTVSYTHLIEGIGPTRRKALMRHFKDIDTIRSATAEELEQVPQMNRKAAESVYQCFHKPEKIQEDNAQAGAGNENT